MFTPYHQKSEIEELVRAFEDTTLPRERWKHHAHLTVGLWNLTQHPEAQAMRRIREGIQRFNAAQGIQITPMGGYHETLTQFWYRVVRDYLRQAGPKADLVELTNDLIRDRGDKQIPFQYYSQERMWSPEARRQWVWPDLKPLERGLAALVVEPVALEGEYVRLEPLSLKHVSRLCDIGLDEELWRWTSQGVHSAGDMRSYVESALEAEQNSQCLPLVTIEKISGLVVGSTRYLSIDCENRRIEIGWTWVARPWQRSAVNTEAKFLMFQHAFETLGCLRVELKTDAKNEQSRAAIQRLGAREEGVLRSHMVTSNGRVRDTVYYSVISSEWPEVKAGLQERLRQRLANEVGA